MAGTIYDMLMGAEPDAAQSAQALAQAIRGKRAMGALGGMAGGGLPGLGKVNEEQALQDQGQMEKATEARMRFGIEKQNRDALLKQTMMQIGSQAAMERERIKAMTSMYGADSRSADAAARTAQGVKIEPDVQKFAKDLEFVSKMPDDLATLRSAVGKDRAGTGPLAGMLPAWAIGDEGNAQRQAAGRLMNAIIYMSSGKQINESEARRLLAARGIGDKASISEFSTGLPKLEAEMRNAYKMYLAKYRPEVVDTFRQRGGLATLEGFEKEKKHVRMNADPKQTGWLDANEFDPNLHTVIP